ncbi:hypothetical protein, partial [Flavobacterium chungangensis]
RVVIDRRATAPMDGSASPRKPRVAMAKRSPVGSLEVAWRSTVAFRDGAAWTDDVTQVPELTVPRRVFDDAGPGALVELTGKVDGTSEVLCVLGFGVEAAELPPSPRVDW